MVAEAHRVLSRGGIYLYPADIRNGYSQGRLRLIYEANPIAWLIEQAGGAASTATGAFSTCSPALCTSASRSCSDRAKRWRAWIATISSRIRSASARRSSGAVAVSELICQLPTRSFPSPASSERARLQCDVLSTRYFIAKISMPPISRAMRSTVNDRAEMKRVMATEAGPGQSAFQPFWARGQSLCGARGDLQAVRQDWQRAHPSLRATTTRKAKVHGLPAGNFNALGSFPEKCDLLFYEGLHGAVVTDGVDIARHADVRIGVVPVVNLEWIQRSIATAPRAAIRPRL